MSSHLAKKLGVVSRGDQQGTKCSFKKKGFDLGKNRGVVLFLPMNSQSFGNLQDRALLPFLAYPYPFPVAVPAVDQHAA